MKSYSIMIGEEKIRDFENRDKVGWSDWDYRCYESLLRNNGLKDNIRKEYRYSYFSEKFECSVDKDVSKYDITCDALFKELISRESQVRKASYGGGYHWTVCGEIFYIYASDGSLFMENLRSAAHFIKEVTHCHIGSLIAYFMRMEEVYREADEAMERIVSLVDYRLAHADEEKNLNEELKRIEDKCRKRIQQKKDCEIQKEEFMALNRRKWEVLRIPTKLEDEKRIWLETWDAIVEKYKTYWHEYRLKKVQRNGINEQKKEDARYREMAERMFPWRKIKPAYSSYYTVFYRTLANGQVVAFMDSPGNPKRIVQHGVKFAELLDGVVGILKKHVKVFVKKQNGKKYKENENDAFLRNLCLNLKDAKMKFEVECLPRSYALSVMYKECGLSFSISSKEFPEGTYDLVKALSAFLKFASESKMDFDIRKNPSR